MAEVTAELAFVIIAIALLLLKMPRWSLAGGLAARLCGHALTLYSAEPYVPQARPSRSAFRELRRFAGGVVTGRLLFSLSSNADYVMVGRLLGPSALGFYGMAWDLLRFVPDRLYKVAGRVTVPAFCRLQDRPDEMRQAFLNFLGYVSRVVVPDFSLRRGDGARIAARYLWREVDSSRYPDADPERRPDWLGNARGDGRSVLRQGPSIDGCLPARFAPGVHRGRGFRHRARRAAGGKHRNEHGGTGY